MGEVFLGVTKCYDFLVLGVVYFLAFLNQWHGFREVAAFFWGRLFFGTVLIAFLVWGIVFFWGWTVFFGGESSTFWRSLKAFLVWGLSFLEFQHLADVVLGVVYF